MRRLIILTAATLVGCGAEEPVESAADADVAPDTADVSEVDTPDTVHDIIEVPDVPVEIDADTDSDLDVDVVPSLAFDFWAPSTGRDGISYPFVVFARNDEGAIDPSISGLLEVSATGVSRNEMVEVLVRRGVGSATIEFDGAGELSVFGGQAIAVSLSEAEPTAHQGEVGSQSWEAGTVHRVIGELTVNGDLTIAEGVWVEVADDTNISVTGGFTAQGTADSPIVFAPAGDAWGGLTVGNSANVAHTHFVGGGADDSREFGHSDSQPIIFGEDANVLLERCVFQDSPGKAMGAVGGAWTVSESVVARTDTGGEFEHVAVTVQDSHYFAFPAQDPEPRDDDNDAIYLLGNPSSDDPPQSRILRSTFLSGADDGVDHNGSTVTIEGSWIEGFDNECIAGSSGGTLTVSDTALVGCEQGLEAGYGSPTIVATHLLVTECETGLRFGDNYSRDYEGTLTVSDSVVFGNSEHAVWNWLFSTEAPADGRLVVNRSLIDTDEVQSGDDNIVGTPILTDGLQLAAGSPGAGIAEGGADPGLLTARPR